MDKRMIEGIEACRPLSDDVHTAELADVARGVQDDPQTRSMYERIQQWDAAVSATMEQVPIPAGLAERILDRLGCGEPVPQTQSAPREQASAVVLPSVEAQQDSASVEMAPETPRFSRRQSLGALVAALAAGLVFAAFLGKWLQPRSDSSLEMLAEGWQQELGPRWQDAHRAPHELAVPSAIIVPPAGWQTIGKKYTSVRGVAYQLVNEKGSVATLFVVRLTQSGLPTAPPAAPQSTTGNKAIGYWQSGGLTYVLVVPNERSYRSFVNASQRPLA